ncbi:mucin-2-like isoform X11 [Vanessa tameamea]|uniref:Mucin-2-like isoform X11 n=1 Tax=Vanessa tameamea TaxID=334116 RepID=A0A8B8I418_VANTA
MRGVWWSAFALLLLVVVTSAIRTAQVEGTSRISRRLPNPDRSPTSSNKSEDVSPTSRSRVSRRREEIQPRDISRSRSRSRPTESPSYTTIKSQNQPERSDRFDSRRSNSRVRSKPVVNEENFDTTVNRENQSKSRSRQSSRYVAAQSMPVPLLTTSPSIGKIQKDFTDIAFNDITKTLSKDVGELNSQIRRRSSTVRTIESVTVPRGRGRINTRTNVRALDLDVSGTANALSTAPKEPTTARTEDIRNSRKLRYKTRQSETDTNLTGEGIATSNEVKSSQIRENVTSQTESKSFSRSTTEKNLRSSTERISLKSSTLKTTKVVKRPVSRNKGKTPLTAQKNKVSDEIKEDDNYPEPFKALIQAKNASTQASSPPSESLSVKASQKVFKTHTTSSQSIITAPDIEKHSRLRSKINLEGNSSNSPIEENIPVIITTTSEQPKPKSVEYRLRGSFKPRSKKSNTLSTSTISTASFSPSVDRTYKFQRKVKLTTTEASNIGNSSQSKSNDTNISFKKPALRSSLYLRRNVSKTVSANSEIPIKIDPSKNNEGKSILKSKQLLPRTSYYSRLRNGGLSTTSTTDSSIQNTTEDISIAEKKVENTAELPIIYTDGTPKVSDNANKQESRNFIITVNSKESSENGTELNGNETISMTVENEKLINNFVSTTQKYHATYKDNNNDISTSSKEKSTVTPLIRNIRTRKYSRKSSKPREEISVVTSKSRERNSRKYSDTFSKTTEASSNGIIAGPEKQKNKFSSKYRASYLDKPFYKPTVPTITPSTVEGEEIQIGPDMNAISFTKSRSPLTSADLRLSESLAKSLQVMNVEASHHSPSVTVSIFDALAEILTSTPRPRISSTTEVLQKQSTNNDVKQINDGVSNNINVNSVKDSTSQDTFMSVDNVNTVAKSVQSTEQSTQDLFNRISVGGITTPSQNTKDRDSTPVTIPQNFSSPTPPPSTPISARKPFAIKVLYADTAPTTDKTTAVMTTNQPTTDSSTMISSSALNITDSSSLGITTSTNKPPAEKSTASHVLSLRTTTMLPSIDEILLNSISSATKEEMVISSMTSTTREPRILTLDIDPETKQIRTEKPDDGNGKTVFKFIPIDEVTVSPQESNVLKLASTKMPKTTTFNEMLQVTTSNSNTQTLQNDISTNGQTSSTPIFAMTSNESSDTTTIFPELSIVMNNIEAKPTTLTPEITTSTVNMAGSMFATANEISTPIPLTTPATTVTTETDNLSTETTTLLTTLQTTSFPSTAAITTPTANVLETAASNQKDAELLQSLLQQIGRSPKNLNNFSNNQQNDNAKLLQAILLGGPQNIANKKTSENKQSSTTIRSIEDDIRQFEEDTKLLKALLLATGRNPAELNLPNLDNTKKVTASTTSIPITTKLITTTDQPTTTQRTTTTIPTTTTTTTTTPTTTTTTTPTTTTTTTTSTTTNIPLITTTLKSTSSGRISELSYNEDLRKLQEDTRLLQALLQATGNQNTANIPIISGITSNVRIASNPLTTSIESNPTTPVNDRPIFTTRPSPVFTAITPETVTVSTLQPQQQTTEEIGISTTFQPFNVRSTTTVRSVGDVSTTTRRPKNSRFQVTTEMPSTSTFSDEEDLQFLQNLKSVLSAKNSGEDPETALANRVIALAVERSLNEIQTGKKVETSTTTYRPTTTTARLMTTTTKMTTTEASTLNTPSIEEDIKQFEQDTKLLQALLKATGQDPSKFNIPTLTNTNRPVTASIDSTTAKPYGPKIAVKDELKNEQDDAQLLQTLIKLQDAQETTTQRSKIAITGQSSDEALKKLLNQAQPAGMVSEATKSSISLSTEFGNSNDALLAALLKEQGFGPTTASSLDEQLRLAALLNQVVVTPKARRTTTPPPPPPAPRRPVLDGLAWLWQQWRETAPGPDVARPNRRPAPSARPSITPSAATSSRVNWFGSGPFVGNADERPTSNRIPLEPPSAVTTEQGPGRGQLVSAAINVTRAFSQFLGAAIQGAAQTVQSVIRAGQRAASDAYTNGSG